MKKTGLFLILIMLVHSISAQEPAIVSDSVELLLRQQLIAFPQEKLYVQTDKSGYLSGERIWFRAHMVDALTHRPVFISRYIYVELINPLDDLVKRVKIRPDSTGAYSGYIDLEDDLVQGAYTLRAYTQFMRNMDEDFFFRKFIQVLDPFSLQIEPLLTFDVEKNDIRISLHFIDRQNSDTIQPEVVTCKIGYGALKTLRPKENGFYRLDARLSEKEKNRTMLLSLIHKGRKYNRYYTIPSDPAEYDVMFFPEGGYLIPGVSSQVAFKALNADGLSTPVSGTLYDSSSNEILSFESIHQGMGLFHFVPSGNESYYVICHNQSGTAKRFDLPSSKTEASIISARTAGDWIKISCLKGIESQQDSLSLLIHYKGQVLLHRMWNPEVEMYNIAAGELPSGIIHILLLNSRQEVLSERLLFNLNENEFALMQATTPESTYKRREHISIRLKMNDPDLTPSTGNIAVSVTDKENVVRDSTINLISTMLLSSELKGHIESPVSYFADGKVNKYALDALMLTQGWNRYDIPGVLQGKIRTPDAFTPELSQRVTGKASGLFRSLKEGQISLLAKLDTLVSTITTQADEKGRFTFNVEYPEGTTILVQSRSKKGGKLNVINIDQEVFPPLQGAGITNRSEAINQFSSTQDSYLKIADEDYTQKNGIRTILLDEVTITAQSLEKYKESTFYSPISAVGLKTAKDIEKMVVSDLRSLLYHQPGIIIRGDEVTTTRSDLPVLFVIDNVNYEDFSSYLDNIEVNSIESIFVLRDNTTMPGYYPNTSGAIVITTKSGNYKTDTHRPPSIDEIVPLGYQQAAEFYSPKYETPEQIESSLPDLRTTIYWKPNVLFSEKGEAVINFYTADYPAVYLLTAEGVNNNGKLIRFTKEITVEGSNSR
ncbi:MULTISPECIES: Plug domain-containing protein [Proteiniphilum]|mgnify:CR=1 FL=1|jgi:hypothetical protein|uniref:Plug domain-containing protein n=1 Tax=Proteiniphilum TaxID=294702 RepID=UPI001EEABBD1|nr:MULTISPECIES: Plug domain-containing protein [Proteiniphilum]ULB34117.1 hypothetical protein KDN43_14250 [Proteiniphilum propionicum]